MKISVVIPAYNGEKFLKACLNSVLQQTRKADQIIVVVDESHDHTMAICQEYGNRIKLYHNSPATGFVDAWNRAVGKAEHEWICLLHQDDILKPDFLESAEQAVKTYPDIRFIYGLCNYIDQYDNVFHEPQNVSKKMIRQTGLEYACDYMRGKANRCPGILAHKEVFHRFPFRKEPGLVADNDFFLRVGSFYDAVRLDQVVASFRHHSESATHTFKNPYDSLQQEYRWMFHDYYEKKIFPDNSPVLIYLAKDLYLRSLIKAVYLDLTTHNFKQVQQRKKEYREERSMIKKQSKIPLFTQFFLSSTPILIQFFVFQIGKFSRHCFKPASINQS